MNEAKSILKRRPVAILGGHFWKPVWYNCLEYNLQGEVVGPSPDKAMYSM